MVYLKSEEELQLMQQSADLLSRTLGEVAKEICPGVTTNHLDKIAESFIRDNGAVPSFLNYNGFPNTLCTSLNDQVVHGIPCDVELRDGDILSVDCGVLLNGFHADSAFTFPIGEISEEVRALLRTTYQSLFSGIEHAIEGRRVGDISNAVQVHCEQAGYSVVRDLVGHGVGKHLHESPEVPNYGKKGSGMKLKQGMVLAIEPMINMGKRNIIFERDGWTTRTADRRPSAHYELTVAVGQNAPRILSSFEYIEQVITI